MVNVERAEGLYAEWIAARDAWHDVEGDEALALASIEAYVALVQYVDAEGLAGTGFDPRPRGDAGETEWGYP